MPAAAAHASVARDRSAGRDAQGRATPARPPQAANALWPRLALSPGIATAPGQVGSPIQLKCAACGEAGDPLEHHVADQTMRMPAPEVAIAAAPPQIIRKCAACDEDETVPMPQTKPAGSPKAAADSAHPRIQRFSGQSSGQIDAVPASVDRVLSSPGRPLNLSLQQEMGQRFGHDFSQVRVHSGEAAKQSAREMNAQAYTVGHNIVFGAGRLAPTSHDGRRLIAHELTHVVQQREGLRAHDGFGEPNDPYEYQANEVADAVAEGRSVDTALDRSALAGGGSGRSLVRGIQRRPSDAVTAQADDQARSEAMWRQVIGEHSTRVGKMARVRAPLGVRLRSQPAPGASNTVILPFDELVQVERKTDHGWCWVVALEKYTGETGFCEEQFLSIDPPEPTAHLYQVQSGETLGAIATRYYGKSMDAENNARLYVQALYIANKGHAGVYIDDVDLDWDETLLRSRSEEETLKIYKGAKVRKGLAIWVPSENFIVQLKAQGLVTSGSTEVMKAWRRVKEFVNDAIWAVKYAAGFIVGLLKGAWNAIADVFKGAAEMIETVAKTLYHLITGNPGKIKKMLMGWVDKLKLAWKNRGQIASDFMDKWEAKSGWDRGLFQGEVLGWVMMTALIVIVTAGAGAIAQISGKWKFVIDVLKLAQEAGDLGTYVRAAGKLPGKAAEIVASKLGSVAEKGGRVGRVAEIAGRAVETTSETLATARQAINSIVRLPANVVKRLSREAIDQLLQLSKPLLLRLGKLKDRTIAWLLGCTNPCPVVLDLPRISQRLESNEDIDRLAEQSIESHVEPITGTPESGPTITPPAKEPTAAEVKSGSPATKPVHASPGMALGESAWLEREAKKNRAWLEAEAKNSDETARKLANKARGHRSSANAFEKAGDTKKAVVQLDLAKAAEDAASQARQEAELARELLDAPTQAASLIERRQKLEQKLKDLEAALRKEPKDTRFKIRNQIDQTKKALRINIELSGWTIKRKAFLRSRTPFKGLEVRPKSVRFFPDCLRVPKDQAANLSTT